MNCKFSLRRRKRALRSARPNGFTLMELLIVMAIITMIMLIAIPTARSLFKHSHELSAKKSLQTIQQAQIMYQDTYPANGFACKLSELGGDPTAGAPTPTSAQILKPDLASGLKDGYVFAITNCSKTTVNGVDRANSYQVSAVPEAVGRSGDRGYCLDQYGDMKSDPTGGSNCTQPVQ
jgi:type IV pilus assembly protein PilA